MKMLELKRAAIAGLVAAVPGASKTAWAAVVFVDDFSAGNTYTAVSPSGNYIASDESSVGTWTASGGTLSYARISQNPPAIDDIFFYSSSILLTNGSSASAGNTAGLNQFTIDAKINDIPVGNTAQPGVIVSGSVNAGGYLITDFTGDNNDFVLLAETGSQLLGDEGGSAAIVKDFGTDSGPAALGHDYSLSVTEDRSGANPIFSVTILDLGPDDVPVPPAPTVYYAGSFQDVSHASDFGGTQIGYRARDAHDEETSTFGSLSLSVSVPEPGFLGFLFPAILLPRRRHARTQKRSAKSLGND
jgi:hypothetical protein